VCNGVALAGTIVVNALANALPLNGMNTGAISDSIPNLFVPAGFTFAVWGVIYVLLLVLVVYQITTVKRAVPTEEPILDLGPWFLISCVANATWIFLWHWLLLIPSLMVMLVLLVSLIIMHSRCRNSSASVGYRIGIMLPISVYLGWITIATVANVTAVLVAAEWGRFGLSEVFWTVAVLVVAIIINMLAVIVKGDIWFALVGIWALYGIYAKRKQPQFEPTPQILYITLLGMAVIAMVILIHLVVKGRKVARGEL
jgi:hypothetical protein